VDRFFVGVAYVLTAVYPFVVVLFLDPATSDDCPECPSNPLLVSDDQTVFDVLAGVQSAVGLIATGALIWHFVRRAKDADPERAPARRPGVVGRGSNHGSLRSAAGFGFRL
jgi:hypothetical protein